jgi:simple sugar transport system permease protein
LRALVVFATWKPSRVIVGAYLFGSVTLAQFQAQAGRRPCLRNCSRCCRTWRRSSLAIISRDATTIRLNALASLGKPYHPE